MLKSSKPIIVVSGDPQSIFLEIFFKSFKKSKRPLILLVNKKVLFNQLKILKFRVDLNEIYKKDVCKKKLNNYKINFIDIPLVKNDSRKYIEKSFALALDLLKENNGLELINGPINKEKFLRRKYPGITEYLGDKTKTLKNVVMLIYSKNLSVSPLTTHIPLKTVHLELSQSKIKNHVKKIDFFYKAIKGKRPRIAVTGLNPHCESNFNSSEEKKIIIPAINFLKKYKYNISGPYPADTIFLRKNYVKYDVIIGMYHDQVLAPIKSLFNFDAINITLGLPFIRISPDHGPNVEMFGKNISNPDSLILALKFLNK